MARYIHCEACNNYNVVISAKYGELYEFIEGTALRDMFCDGACTPNEAKPIKKGDKCFAAVLLTSNKHFNYEKQKPEVWAKDYIKIKE
jgi:hypothetical protein